MTEGIRADACPLEGARRQRPYSNLQLHRRPNGYTAARGVALSIHEHVSALVKFPERGRIGRKPGTRELVLTGLPYLAVYRIRGNSVEILRILHGAQDWQP